MNTSFRKYPKKITLLFLVALLTACTPAAAPTATATATAPSLPTIGPTEAATTAASPTVDAPINPQIILATTTSTQDSGLLDVLIPLFEKQSGYIVKTIAVGTGQALKMGAQGNADVLLVHSPSDVKAFMDDNFGKDKALIMHNDFVIVGPPSDPAKIKGLSLSDAFTLIAKLSHPFVSRGDDSGTHKVEVSLWEAVELKPSGQFWYLESGQGMGATLTIASEKRAYTISDRATFLANQTNLDLKILLEGDSTLLNFYHVVTVNPEKWPLANYLGAVAFMDFLKTPETQLLISSFGLEQFGQPLFFADGDKTDADYNLP